MPNGQGIQQALTQPLAALEELLRAPAVALQQGINQLNQTATRGRLPALPQVPEPPRIFSGNAGHRSSK